MRVLRKEESNFRTVSPSMCPKIGPPSETAKRVRLRNHEREIIEFPLWDGLEDGHERVILSFKLFRRPF